MSESNRATSRNERNDDGSRRDSSTIISESTKSGDFDARTIYSDDNETIEQPPISTRSLTSRPTREGDKEDIDYVSPRPPSRRTIQSRERQQKGGVSFPSSRSNKDGPSNRNMILPESPPLESSSRKSSSSLSVDSKTSLGPKVQKHEREDKNRGKTRTASGSQTKSKDSSSSETSRQSNSHQTIQRSVRSTEKTRTTDRVALSRYLNGRNQNTGNGIASNTENPNTSDVSSVADQSLSTAPDPPSLRVRDNYASRPGAIRMFNGGVARYVTDDTDDYSVEYDNIVTAENVIPINASLVEDVILPSPPPMRPTTSEGYSHSGIMGRQGYSRNSNPNNNNATGTFVHTTYSMRPRPAGDASSVDPTTVASLTVSTMSPEKKGYENKSCWSKRITLVAVGLSVLLIVVLTSVGIVLVRKGSGNDDVIEFDPSEDEYETPDLDAPVTPPEWVPIEMESFVQSLPQYSMKSLQIEDSPQSKALRWMFEFDDLESYSSDRQLQRFALMSLVYSISDTEPTRETLFFFADLNECEWFESICVNDLYTSLSLPSSKAVRGTLIPELAMLKGLESLQMDQNGLIGVLPTELGTLTNLKKLNMNENLIRGTIPTEFGKLSNLETVDLSNNLFSGSLPTEIGWLDKVQNLNLNQNNLTGKIPSEIGRMNELIDIRMSSNNFEGELPSEVGRLGRLEVFNAKNNFLSGEFVSKFVGSAGSLKELRLHSNEFSGTLSPQVSLLSELNVLDLSENNLVGSLPTDLALLVNLVYLNLDSNGFDGKIPTDLGLLENIRTLSMTGNFFTGGVPMDVCRTVMFTEAAFDVDCGLVCICCFTCP